MRLCSRGAGMNTFDLRKPPRCWRAPKARLTRSPRIRWGASDWHWFVRRVLCEEAPMASILYISQVRRMGFIFETPFIIHIMGPSSAGRPHLIISLFLLDNELVERYPSVASLSRKSFFLMQGHPLHHRSYNYAQAREQTLVLDGEVEQWSAFEVQRS